MNDPTPARSTSRLLIDEPPLVIQPSLACAVGLNEALILQQVHYWLNRPSIGKDADGRHWVKMTHEDWLDQFPFLGLDALRRAIKNVKAKGVLLSCRDLGDSSWDRSTWYSIDYAVLDAIDIPKRETASRKKNKNADNGAKSDAVPSSANPTMHDSVSPSSSISNPDVPSSGDPTIITETTVPETTTEKKDTSPDGDVPRDADAHAPEMEPERPPHPPGQYALVDGVLTGPFNNYNAARAFAPTGRITQTPPRDLVAVPPAKPGRKPKADGPRLEQPPADVKDAFALLCYNGTAITGASWARLIKAWNRLEKPPAEKFATFTRWWKACDWRGVKGQRPTPEQVVSEWDVAQNWDGATVPRTNGYQTATERNDDILKRSLDKMLQAKAAKEAKDGN